eukprot:CAMPEP_0169075538 /NCGR_PEP_ID=MMETSP1015-20121227/7874_1 /TAXON_ID=342587 /ORGANISM="Karlodinium micrum, Strain CCMP2283" /LENGTH=79 /DNA_ID=CAMNT_0009134953 /DNA_START=804 /DNA_END=1040 /DNA_ORIENTATION=-
MPIPRFCKRFRNSGCKAPLLLSLSPVMAHGGGFLELAEGVRCGLEPSFLSASAASGVSAIKERMLRAKRAHAAKEIQLE